MLQKVILLTFSLLLITPSAQSQQLVLPNFSLPTVENMQEMLSDKDLLGQAFVLNVWESQCIPCIEEHPLLLQLEQNGIVVYGINVQDDLAMAKRFLEKRGNPFKATIFDQQGELSKQLGVIGTPVTFVVGKKGDILYKKVGKLTLNSIQDISRLISHSSQ